MEREFRSGWQWSDSTSSTITHVPSRGHRILNKIIPCLTDDFSSSLARSEDFRGRAKTTRMAPAVLQKKNRSFKSRSRKPSRRNSSDRYEKADCCEKGDVLETVTSIGSLGSAPTLVDSHKEIEWRLSESTIMSNPRRTSETTFIVSPRRASETTFVSSPRRVSGATLGPPLSPITPLSPVLLLREEEEDEILRYP